MKRAVFLIITIILCVALFQGCAKDATEVVTQGEFCRVLCIKEDGIVVEIPDTDLGYVYVKYTNADLEIEPLDTVVIEFSESDLKSANEKFTDFFGEELTYLNILENPKSIRLADPSIGEPTFG